MTITALEELRNKICTCKEGALYFRPHALDCPFFKVQDLELSRYRKRNSADEGGNMGSNLPPGVTPGMLPGNRPEDTQWENFIEFASESLAWGELTIEEAYMAVTIGKASVLAIRPDIESIRWQAVEENFRGKLAQDE